MPATTSASPTAVKEWPVLLLLIFLSAICTVGPYLLLKIATSYYPAAVGISQLLAQASTVSSALLIVAGWLISTCWGPKRTMQAGAMLVSLACAGLAAYWATMFPITALPQVLPVALGALSLGNAMLTLGVLTTIGIRYRNSTRIFTAFLLVRLLEGLVSGSLPLILGIGLDTYSAPLLLGIFALIAAGLLAVLWRRFPITATSIYQFEVRRRGWGIGVLILSFTGASLLLSAPRPASLMLGVGLVLGSGQWGILWWKRKNASPGVAMLLWYLLGVGAVLLLVNAAIVLGYGGNAEYQPTTPVIRILLWSLGPLLILVLALRGSRKQEPTVVSQRLVRFFGGWVGLGVVVLAAVLLVRGGPLPSGPLPEGLPLQVGTVGLQFLLPVLISQRTSNLEIGPYLALSMLLATLTAEISTVLLG